ncbi:hypothetical protein HCN44_002009 [Aphidius gifuensis]|uniref:Odorant receptor n=1 Tax=Aphidius gifuensis TaxID=684658 RepID=A0A835CUF4_APHGI|nr:hypothetical protein HCN44_002009 [Aphidius gifuensis]
MKEILDCIKKDWLTVNDNEEKKILDEYAYIGKIISIGYTSLSYIAAGFYIVDPSLTYCYEKLLDSNHSMPETRLYTLPMYFNGYDVGIYYFLALCINYFDTMALTTLITSNDILFVIFVQHICGQFKVLGYRIKKTMSSVLNSDERYEIINKSIIAHNELIRQSEKIESIYSWCFLFLIGINVLLLNLTVVQLLISPKMIQTVFKFSIYMAIQVIHMGFLCTMSQQLINHSLQLSESIYEAMWYTKSLKIQNMCKLMILRSQVPCQLSAG